VYLLVSMSCNLAGNRLCISMFCLCCLRRCACICNERLIVALLLGLLLLCKLLKSMGVRVSMWICLTLQGYQHIWWVVRL